MEVELTELFIFVDDFYKLIEQDWNQYRIDNNLNKRIREPELHSSEIMTILIFYHTSGFKCLKTFYLFLHRNHLKEFPNLVSYNRFLELQQNIMIPFLLLFYALSGRCDGISFIDATPLPVCHVKRSYSHKVSAGMAQKSKSTMGWYFGFKLHLICNSIGHPLSFCLTDSCTDDRYAPDGLFKNIFGKLFGDKGYLGQNFFIRMKNKMIHIITAIRKNMKPQFMTYNDSENLKKRGLIETTLSVLKTRLNLQHTRHRSPKNFCVNIVGAMCAYCLRFVNGLNHIHQYLEQKP